MHGSGVWDIRYIYIGGLIPIIIVSDNRNTKVFYAAMQHKFCHSHQNYVHFDTCHRVRVL